MKKIRSFYELDRGNFEKNACCTDFGIITQATDAASKWNNTDSSLSLTYKGLFEDELYEYSTLHIN